MMQDCASSNKIKENKYKILRMSLLLGSDEDREETIRNFEDAARDIDEMNDEIFQKDIEQKFYDTLTLEEEEKKLAVLVDYIGGRVEQRISLLSDFANVTGYDLQSLPPIKYYDKLDDYKDRLKYIREYLGNTNQINLLNEEIEQAEKELKDAYMNKATSEECNSRNEEIILNKFSKLLKTIDDFKDVTEDNIDSVLNNVIAAVEDSKKSLDIFTKSFTTLSGSGISYEEEEEYRSYVSNAEEVYYKNKEQEYLLRIYKHLLTKEVEYGHILVKREAINDILYERLNLRDKLNIKDNDLLANMYDILQRQYDDIRRQSKNIDNIEILTENISQKKERLNELEQDNQKVEILALLREFCMIDTYNEFDNKTNELENEIASLATENNNPLKEEAIAPETTQSENSPAVEVKTEATEVTPEMPKIDIFSNMKESTANSKVAEVAPAAEPPKDNQVIKVEDTIMIDLDLVHSKASKVMQRVGEMLGIKPREEKIVSVEENKKTDSQEEKTETTLPSQEFPKVENPLFNNTLATSTTEESTEEASAPEEENIESSFWFASDTPDALNELPDLEVSNNNFFADNNIPDLGFPDLKINFDNNNMEEK